MPAYVCEVCGGAYIKIEEKKIGDMTYEILRCEKCNHQIARAK